MPARALSVVITGDVKGFEAALRRAGLATGAFAKKNEAATVKTANAGRVLTRRVTLPIIALGAAAGKMSVDFSGAMERIHTQAGASQREVVKMSKAILAMSGRGIAQGPEELSQGLYHLESIGLRGAKALNALKIAAQGASVGNADLEETASALGSAWLVNIKGAGNLHHVMGLLNATVGAGNMRMGDLVEALGTGLLPAAKVAGLSIRDVMGAMAVFTDENYNASSAAAQFSTALHFLYNPGIKASGALESIGLKSTTLAQDMHKPNGLLTALRDLHDHLSKLSTVKQEQVMGEILPGGRGRILLVLLNQLDRYEKKLAQIKHTSSNFGEDVAKTQATDAFRIKEAWAETQAAMVKFGGGLAPTLGGAADVIRNAADAFEALPESGRHAIGVGLGIAAAFGPVIFVGAKVVGAIQRVTESFKGLAAMEALGFLPELGPIGAAVGAVGGLGAAILLLSRQEDHETAAAERNAAAKKAQAAAERDLSGRELSAGQARVAAQQATLGVAQAEQNLNRLRAEGKRGTLDYRQAEIDLANAKIASAQAHRDYNTALGKQRAGEQEIIAQSAKRVKAARDELLYLRLTVFARPNASKRAEFERLLTQALIAQKAAGDRVKVSDLNRARAAAGLSLITTKQATNVHALQLALRKLPPSTKARILLDNAGAVDKAGALSKVLEMLGKRKTVHHILATSSGADQAVGRLREALGRVEKGKTVAKVDANTEPAVARLGSLKASLAAFARQVTYHDVYVRYHDSGPPASTDRGGGGGTDQAVARLRDALGRVEKGKTVAKVDADTGPAAARLAALAKRLEAFGRAKTVHHILATSSNADQAVAALAKRLEAFGRAKTVHRILATSSSADQAVARLRDALGRVEKGKTVAKVDADTGPAAARLAALKDSLAAFARQVTYHDVYVRYHDSGPPASTGGGGGSHSPRVITRAAQAGLLFGTEARLQALEDQRTALEETFTRLDQARAVAKAQIISNRRIVPVPKVTGKEGSKERERTQRAHDKAKDRNDTIRQARKDLADLAEQARRTNKEAAIDFKIKGLERLKNFNDAISSIRDSLHDLATQAAASFRQGRETVIDSNLTDALATLDTSKAGELLRERHGLTADPRVAELAALEARAKASSQAAEDAQNQQVLADAQKKKANADEQLRKAQEGLAKVQNSGSQRLIDAANRRIMLAQAAVDAGQKTIDSANSDIQKTADQRRADDLAQELDDARSVAQDKADAAKEGLDKEESDYKASLDQRLSDLADNLNAGRESYKQFVADVQAILAPLGQVFTPTADQEQALTAPPPTPPPPAPGTGAQPHPHHHKPPHKHRAAGGTVQDILGEFARVNEVGQEAFDFSNVWLPKGTHVTPASEVARDGNGGPLIGQVIIENGGELGEDAIAERLAFKLAARRR